ncbi:TPA: hypothetical protein ACYLN4_001095 [Burkholderia lata]
MKTKIVAMVVAAGCVMALSGCVASPVLMHEGSISVLATHGPTYLPHPGPDVAVHVSSLDNHNNEADLLNDTLARAGYEVGVNKKTTFVTIRETFAGNPAQYQTSDSKSSPVSGKMAVSVLSSTALCALVSVCANPGTMGNVALSAAQNSATDATYTAKGDDAQKKIPARLLVVNEVCTFSGCVSTYASTQDPAVTIDELRAANVIVGMPVALQAAKTP